MNGNIRYRLFFNDEPAGREELDRVERITVEQEIDMAWEAQLEVPICLDANGRWGNANESILKTARRVRVEVSVGGNAFVPLIDGPVIDTRNKMSYQPAEFCNHAGAGRQLPPGPGSREFQF